MLLELLVFLPYRKVTATYSQLAYGVPDDYVDVYVLIRESTSIEYLWRFVRCLDNDI
jgi:hypothetical protein